MPAMAKYTIDATIQMLHCVVVVRMGDAAGTAWDMGKPVLSVSTTPECEIAAGPEAATDAPASAPVTIAGT